jgi:hypothetical protein
MKHFFRKLDEIDSVISSGASRENAGSLIALMTEAASTVYVLSKIDASWLEPLESIGYFRGLSSGDGQEKDETQVFWPASAYLKRIATEADTNRELAQTLQRVLSFIPGPGSFYAFRDIVDTTLLLPKEMRRGVVPFIQRAIGKRLSIEFSNVTALLVRLAEEGEVAAALRLFSSVFSVFPTSTDGQARAKSLLTPEPDSFMDAWNYKQEMAKCLPALTQNGGFPFLSCLCRLLVDYLRLSSSRPAFQGPDDLSYIWRPAIEGHEQNIHEDPRETLVTAIRDCATSLVLNAPASFVDVSELLAQQQWFIFTRVLLHLLSTAPTAPLNLIGHYSTQPHLFSEVTVRHEYSLLLRARFRVLTDEQRNAVLKMIENGPDRLTYVRAMTRSNNEAPPKEEVEAYVEGWKLDWLSFIADDLPDDWAARYEALRETLPPPLHPEFPYFTSSTWGLGGRMLHAQPRRPGDADSETIEGLLDRIGENKPEGGGPAGTELDRLMEALQAAAEANPQAVLERIDEIATLPPRYLAVIATALANRTDAAEADLMSPLMRLGDAVAEGLRTTEDSEERERLRNSLTGILDQFFRDDSSPLEAEHLQHFREMAESLLSTVTLTPGQQAYGGSEDFDPLFWAINSPDGRIVENAIKVALRERKLQGDVDFAEPGWLLETLADLLAVMAPDEVRITAILGYRFPWLVHLSKSWATDNADKVFPLSPEWRWRWEAAWCTYVGYSGAYNDVLEILRNQYAKAVKEVSTKHIFKKTRLHPEKDLAQHLAIYYWRQLLPLQHPLITEFLSRAGEEPVRAFISSIGRGMGEVEGIPTNVTESLRTLAEWMAFAWKPRGRGVKKALAAFGWWFPHGFLGDASWRLRILRSAAKKAGELENIDRVLKELELLAPENPTLVIDCLSGLTEGGPKESSVYYLAMHSAGILEKAIGVANAPTRARIGQIADYFGANGHFEYRRFA